MAWDYNISKDGGDLLHHMILEADGEPESTARILDQIQVCCETVIKMLTARGDTDAIGDFEEIRELIHGELSLPQGITESDEKLDDLVEFANDCLDKFYDCCDTHRIWLGTGFSPADESQQAQHGEMSL